MSNIQYFTDGEQATAAVLNRPLKDLEKSGQYMSKAQFEALASSRKEQYAGSGFIKLGPPNWTSSAIGSLAASKSVPNGIVMGTNAEGDTFNVNGVSQYIHSVGYNNQSRISFPPAPTCEAIIKDNTDIQSLKQADFLFLDRSDDLIGYTKYYISGRILSYEYDNGSDTLTIEDDTDNVNGYVSLKFPCIPGVSYIVTISVDSDMVFDSGYYNHLNIDGHITKINDNTIANTEYNINFTGGNSSRIILYASDTTATYKISIKQSVKTPIVAKKDYDGGDIYLNYSDFRAVDSVSRQDLVFLETWHENVADKDIVYPYGNIQYRGGNTDGLSNIGEGSFAGKETYSLFGNWQSEDDLVGLGYKWSDLSNEDKLKFAGNKDNNIYKDGDNIIQVRYRIRVVKGTGNNWNASIIDDYRLQEGNTLTRVQAKAWETSIQQDLGGFMEYSNVGEYLCWPQKAFGLYSINSRHLSFDSAGFAIPIALVQRRNDGAFDPVHNPEGSGTFTDGKEWFETSDSHNSLVDCFNNKANGYIGTASGRPDGLFANEINERDVEDLRMSALKKPYKEILDEYHNKMVKNKLRGKNKLLKITKLVNNLYENTTSISFRDSIDGLVYCPQLSELFASASGGYLIIDNVYFKIIPNNRYSNNKYYNSRGLQTLTGEIVTASVLEGILGKTKIAQLSNYYTFEDIEVYSLTFGSYTENKITTHCDIIGDPRKLSDRVKYTVVDGTSQVVSLLRNDHVLNDDGHIYRALVTRDDIDLDTDDYTDTTNWIDLGTDGTIGGYPQEWLDEGHIGTPNIVTNGGINNIPLNHKTGGVGCISISLSKKVKDLYGTAYMRPKKVVFTNSRTGESYELPHNNNYNLVVNDDHYGTYGLYANNTLYLRPNQNDYTDIDFWVFEVFYETHADALTPSYSHLETLEVKKDIYSGARYEYSIGGKIADDLLCNVSTSDANHYDYYVYGQLYSYRTEPWNVNNFDRNLHEIRHTGNITEIVGTSKSNVKYTPILINNNGACEISYLFKELKYTDGTWGDDNIFDTDYYVATKLDDNDQYVAYGHKAIRLPYFSNK